MHMKDPFSDYHDQFKNSKELDQLMGDILKYLPLGNLSISSEEKRRIAKLLLGRDTWTLMVMWATILMDFFTMTYTHELSAFSLCVAIGVIQFCCNMDRLLTTQFCHSQAINWTGRHFFGKKNIFQWLLSWLLHK